MARKPNYRYERMQREKAKSAKREAKREARAAAKAEKQRLAEEQGPSQSGAVQPAAKEEDPGA